jgi:hypothetical protein
MQSTPIGPTGAAMEKPMAKPLSKKVNATCDDA